MRQDLWTDRLVMELRRQGVLTEPEALVEVGLQKWWNYGHLRPEQVARQLLGSDSSRPVEYLSVGRWAALLATR